MARRLFWIAFALLVTFHAGKIPPAALPATLGKFLLAWGIFTGYMTIAATTLSRPMLIVFVLLTITFFMLATANFTAVAAWYASAITVIASTRKA